jgi:general secretion pathway protein K
MMHRFPPSRSAARGISFGCSIAAPATESTQVGGTAFEERAPLRPSGGRGRGPSRSDGRVRWAAPRECSSAPLTLPSPPGRRGERGEERVIGSKFRGKSAAPIFPDSPAPSRADLRNHGGFALIIVLWTLVLIAFIVAQVTASGRTEIRIAGNIVSNSVAQAAADGAIFEAIFNLSDPRPEARWPVDGSARRLAIGNSQVTLWLEDENSRINPSTASPALLEALFRVTGNDAETARRLAAAIGDWVGSAGVPRPQNALIAEYRAAGLDYGPPGAPLETLDELDRVLGMTPDTLMAIRPHLTLFGTGEPNPATTDPIVAAALALLPQTGTAAALSPAPADALTVRMTAVASGPGNARVVRSAIVRMGAGGPAGYTILAWGTASDPGAAATALGRPLTR